jgi:hypothetical protein
MSDRTARSLEFAARIEKRRRAALAAAAPMNLPELPSVEKLKEKAAGLIASLENAPAVTVPATDTARTAEETAALCGRFDPAELITILRIEGSAQLSTLSRLAAICSIETAGRRTLWLLYADRRAAALQRMIAQNRLAAGLDGPLPAADRMGSMLRRILRGEPVLLPGLEREDLLAISWSLEALAGIDLPKPDITQVHQLLARTQFLAEYEVLLEKGFFGREPELARLSAFLESPEQRRRLLLLSGLGGAGKSTLLARFARDSVVAAKATVVVLDFDRPGIDARDTLWLEMDMARQVGAQFPDSDQKLRQAREDVRESSAGERHAQEQFSSEGLESARGHRAGLLYPIAEVLHSASRTRPFLLILDTFEEVVQRDLAWRALDWLAEVESLLWPTPLRVIISGRLFENKQGFLQGYAAEEVQVAELSPSSAEEFLRRLGVSDAAARRLAGSDVLPRRPLELKLLGKLVADSPATSIDDLERELREGGGAARDLFAGLVYRRVLLRISVPEQERTDPVITDSMLRTLAYPGLVLRYVTPDLIRQVLVPALDLPPLDETQAARALDLLARHEWLAYRQGVEVWHRRDLRRSVLKPMIAENPERARRIHMLAVAAFNASPDDSGRSESFYHRLMSISSEDDGAGWDLDAMRKSVSRFEADRHDLPPAGDTLLTFAMTGEVEVDKVRLLPRAFRDRAYETKGESLVNSREFGRALQLYTHRDKALLPWERTLLWSTAEWHELWTRLEAVPGFRTWSDLGGALLPGAVTGALDLDELTKALELLRSDFLISRGLSTTLQSMSVGIVMIADGGFPVDGSEDLTSLLEKFADLATTDPVLEKRVLFLKLLASDLTQARLPIGPSTIRLDPAWLDEAPGFLGRLGPIPPPALSQLTAVRKILTEGVGGQRTARTLLSYVQFQKDTYFVPINVSQADPASLWRYLESPNPEFRDPARYSLLEAFPDQASYSALAGLFASAVPFPVDDLQPEAFAKALAADPERALESYVELADRAGVLETLLEKALALRPQSRKLQAVRDALARWREAARKTVFGAQF